MIDSIMSDVRRLAVVTGASSGIGREIALTLASHGWDVAFSFIGDKAAADDVVAAIVEAGGKGLGVLCDVGIKSEVATFYSSVLSVFGRAPDLLVNNAGVQTWASLLELREEDWDRVIRTNLKGCFLNTQRAAQLMVEHKKRGSIINIGSGCNKVPFPRLVDYTASKGGIEQFTKVAALELGPHGIRVNCVAPGAIELERTKHETPHYAETWAQVAPLKRVGQPVDVANVVLFLAGKQADFVTGQTLYVDGGAFSMPSWPYKF
jgi:NAD(P)-dependent dehydrogenase (short-subunit alcohol dehydrogenase family)